MARVSLALCCSHSPFLYTPPELWNEIRKNRSIRTDVPHDSDEENAAKYNRCLKGFAALKEKIEQAKPDVLVVFGDDQQELFNFNNFPAFAIYMGAEFEGYRILSHAEYTPDRSRGKTNPKTPEHWVKLRGHPEFAKELLAGLIHRGFDLAFSMEMPTVFDVGMTHAVMRPAYSITPNYHIPIVPILVNCYYAPQPTARRCYELGKAVRQVIEESPLDLKVAVLGSGGLWHTPGARNNYVDEKFDGVILDAIRKGEGRRMADHFDNTKPPVLEAREPGAVRRGKFESGLPGGGIGSGTGETRNWIAVGGVMDGIPGTVVDYVPVYASPCAMGFAFWDKS